MPASATRTHRGDSPPIGKVVKIQPSNVVIGDPFTIGCGNKSLTYYAAAATAQDVVAGLVALLNATALPEFREMLASPSSDGTYLTLTAVTAGVPFTVTVSTSAAVGAAITIAEATPGKLAVNEVHKVSLSGAYTGGTFTLTYNVGAGNVTTGNIAYNANAASVQAALVALAGVGAGQVVVTGGPGPNSPWFVQWTGTLGGQVIAVGTVNGASLTGAGGLGIAKITNGNGPSDEIQLLDTSVMLTQGIYNFTLALDGQTTTTLTTGMTAAQIQTALQALPNVGSGNCLVYGGEIQNGEGTIYAIHFTGTLAGVGINQLVVGGWSAPWPIPVMSTLQNGGQATSDDFQFIDLGFANTASGTAGTLAGYTVTYSGQTTSVLSNSDNNANQAAALQTALQALSTIGAANVTVYGPSYIGGTSHVTDGFLVRFTGAKANTQQSLFTVTCAAGTPTVTRISVGKANSNDVQTITVFGTGGTFTLTAGVQTTSAIAWNASTGTLQTRIQTDLSTTFTAVTVTGAGTVASPYQITTTNPANTNIASLTGSGASLTGGGGTILELTAGAAGVSEVQTVTLAAGVTGGTFKLTFNGAQTGTIAYNATNGTVQTAIQALSTINTATVAGSAGGPYTVTWSGAQASSPQSLLVGDGSLLNGPAGTLTLTTLTWSAGPNHYDDPLNWTGGVIPNSNEAVVFDPSSSSCMFGLNQISTFTWATGPNQGTWAAADLVNGQSVYLTTTNTLPAGLAAATPYYLINVNRDTGTFQLSATPGGTAISVTTTGTGTHTIGVRLYSFEFNSRETGGTGLPRNNSAGYFEYRPLYLHIGLLATGAQTVTIGTGKGSGAPRVQIDTDVDQAIVKVIDTGGAAESGIAAMLWKGQHAANTLNVVNGSVGVSLFPGETAVLASVTQRGGTLELGPGLTLNGPIDNIGGTLVCDGATINGTVLSR